MKSQFEYATQTLGNFQCNTPKEMMWRILSETVNMLRDMERDHNLEERLCEVCEQNPNPWWVENAERCRDRSFRKKGIAAANKLVNFIQEAPEDLEPFLRMRLHGRVTEDVAAKFETNIWVMLISYAFFRERHTKDHGSDAMHFLYHAAALFQPEFEHIETVLNMCASLGELTDPNH